MKTYQINLVANEPMPLNIPGRYFILLDTSQPVDVELYRANGSPSGEKAEDVEAGYSVRPVEPFGLIRFESATTQTIKVAVTNGEGEYNRTIGAVDVTNSNGAFSQSRDNVTNVAETILAANANRRYLAIQNNDASQVLRITLDGDVPSATVGFRIQPGELFEVPAFCCTGAVNAIMEGATATANNVEWVEG